jgi:multiple sugar transport system permease protein
LPFVLLLPSVLILVLVVGFPLLYSLYLSFTDYSLLNAQNYGFVGLANYDTLVRDPIFWRALLRTVVFITLAVNLELVLGLGIAHLMARAIRRQGLLRTMMMVPMMFPPILVGFQFKWFFNDQVGLVNNVLYSLTGGPRIIPWLVDVPLGFISLLVAEIWMSTPFMVIVLEAGLLSIPRELNEAAEVDGASGWERFRHVTLPLLRPFIYAALAIRSLDIARAYDLVSIMTGGGPANRTELIWTYVYRLAFDGQNFALGSSMSYVTVLLSIFFTWHLFRSVVRTRWEGRA